MSLFSKLFGGGGGGSKAAAKSAEPVVYNDFHIFPEPMKDGGAWRVAARIEKDGQVHQLIRADTLQDQDAAVEASVGKAKQVIDEQGERIFQ